MNLKHLITANQKNFQTIGVCLNNGNGSIIYTYKAPIEMVLSPGDTVIVAKGGNLDEGVTPYRAVKVREVHEHPQIDYTSDVNYKWIVDKVDDVAYLEQVELEQEQAQQLAHMELTSKKREFMKYVEETSPNMLEFFDKPEIPQPK